MKYGYIKKNKVIYVGRIDGDNWYGRIEYDENDNQLTAQEMIAKHSLKPITTPNDFNGRYGDYNFSETETEITILDMTDTAKKENKEKTIKTEIATLKRYLAETDYITLKYSEAKSGAREFNNGEEEKCLQVIAEREAKREQIRLLELQI